MRKVLIYLSLVFACSAYAVEPFADTTNSSLKIWQNYPVDPELVSSNDEGIHVKEGNQKIQWDVWGLPIGNGRLGAVFFGNVENELVRFNENSLWTGGDDRRIQYEGERKNTKRNYGSYQPFGDIHLTFPYKEFSNYSRELDISSGVGKVSFKCNGIKYYREYFASYPDQVIVIRLSADYPGSITGTFGLSDRHFAKITTENNKITAQGTLDEKLYLPKGFYDIAYGTEEQRENAKFVFAGNNMKYESQLKVIAHGGSITYPGDNEIKVTNANSVVILLAAGTDFILDASKNWKGEDPHKKVSEQIKSASEKEYSDLYLKHVNDFQGLFNRLQLNLGQSDLRKTSLSMRERLEDYRKDPNDPELVTLMTQFGRYLIISSSRTGGLPANLQGLWNPDRLWAPWSADYHLNINLEMNYWLTGPGDLSECDEPLLKWLKAIMPVRTRQTKENFGGPGWTAGWGINLFGSGSGHSMIEGPWICQHLYENYKFTHDVETLKEISFPIIQQAVRFWENRLVEKNGKLLVPDVQSPEWGPKEDGVLYAQELVWELFSEYIELADILGVDKEHRNKIENMRDKLATPKVGSKGQLMEWQTEYPNLWGNQHRHISHMVGLYPGRQMSPVTTPALAEAAKITLEQRGVGSTGWSKIHKAAIWARLYDGDESMELVEAFLKTHIWPSGLSSINAGDKFQIDANLGMPAVIFEQLLQSQNDELHLLPALPSCFPEGSVQGIRGRGGYIVDITWVKGKLSNAVIHSTFGESCKVRYGDEVIEVKMQKGDKVFLSKEDF